MTEKLAPKRTTNISFDDGEYLKPSGILVLTSVPPYHSSKEWPAVVTIIHARFSETGASRSTRITTPILHDTFPFVSLNPFFVFHPSSRRPFFFVCFFFFCC